METENVKKMYRKRVKEIECCEGCKAHHIPELGLERLLGKCVCPCHTNSEEWPLEKIKITVEV